MFVIDHPRIHATTFRRCVTLDEVYTNVESLRWLLEERLGVRITDLRIDSNDFVREDDRRDNRLCRAHRAAPSYLPSAYRLERVGS